MRNKEITYCSWTELNTQESREKRHTERQYSRTSMVNHPEYISLWAAKMKEDDPDRSEARRIASRYRP